MLDRRHFIAAAGATTLLPRGSRAADRFRLDATSPMPPPEWASLQRELLRLHTEACEIFHAKYFDARNHLL